MMFLASKKLNKTKKTPFFASAQTRFASSEKLHVLRFGLLRLGLPDGDACSGRLRLISKEGARLKRQRSHSNRGWRRWKGKGSYFCSINPFLKYYEIDEFVLVMMEKIDGVVVNVCQCTYGWALGELNFRRKIAIRERKKASIPFHENHAWLTLIPIKGRLKSICPTCYPTLWVFFVRMVLGHQRGGHEIDHLQILAGSFGGSNHFEPKSNRKNVSFVDAWGQSTQFNLQTQIPGRNLTYGHRNKYTSWWTSHKKRNV